MWKIFRRMILCEKTLFKTSNACVGYFKGDVTSYVIWVLKTLTAENNQYCSRLHSQKSICDILYSQKISVKFFRQLKLSKFPKIDSTICSFSEDTRKDQRISNLINANYFIAGEYGWRFTHICDYAISLLVIRPCKPQSVIPVYLELLAH